MGVQKEHGDGYASRMSERGNNPLEDCRSQTDSSTLRAASIEQEAPLRPMPPVMTLSSLSVTIIDDGPDKPLDTSPSVV